MNWKSLFAGAAAGFAAGFAVKQILNESGQPSPEKVLSNVKNFVKKDGKIYGAWILMKPEAYEKFNLDYTVYKGGITRHVDGSQEQFEFVADAETGTVLDLIPKS
ncbi:Predicted small secreted protein [Bacillus sp. OV322]|uniref:PepSY domain-containing protein n=1 Tax=Bacillus sp. OV322 TaxID=1882764 RepID=UPI0008F31B7D|nr:PepSY domain-containing protein [Bacillus sp. OV322]SFC58548.1 Predicted small secreted protein [Bacillus sp. OV322]